MRITESGLALWASQRSEATAAGARERRLDDAGHAASIVAHLNMLDTDRDGWIDEDDLPYDQLLLLERARAAEAVDDAPPPERAPAAVAPAAEQRPPRPEPSPPPVPDDAPHIDLLA